MSKNYSREEFINILYPKLPYRSIKKDYDYSKNVNSKICSECGGECCKRCGCHFSPDDFKEISFEKGGQKRNTLRNPAKKEGLLAGKRPVRAEPAAHLQWKEEVSAYRNVRIGCKALPFGF